MVIYWCMMYHCIWDAMPQTYTCYRCALPSPFSQELVRTCNANQRLKAHPALHAQLTQYGTHTNACDASRMLLVDAYKTCAYAACTHENNKNDPGTSAVVKPGPAAAAASGCPQHHDADSLMTHYILRSRYGHVLCKLYVRWVR